MRRSISIVARSLLILLTCSALYACGGVSKAATAVTADIVKKGIASLESESDLFIAKESIVPLIKIIEVLQRGDPNNKIFLTVLAQSCGNYAFGFIEPELIVNPNDDVLKKRAKHFYQKGLDYGLKGLKRKHAFRKALNKDIPSFERVMHKFNKNDATLLFWTAFDWGSVINYSKDDPSNVVNLPRVEAMIERVVELDPNFGYGLGLAYNAALLASRPPMFGGDPVKAGELFKRAVAVTDGKYLMIKTLMAEWYAVRIQDKALFNKLLGEVIASPGDLFPEQALANDLAKERAAILLKAGSKFF